MSFWYEPKLEDMEIDRDEINIYLGQDDSGSIYAAVKISDLNEILKNVRSQKRKT